MIRVDTYRIQRRDSTFYTVEIIHVDGKHPKIEKEQLLQQLNSRLSLLESLENPYISGLLFLKRFYQSLEEATPLTSIPIPFNLKRR